jgi:hypothetical protein
MTDDVDAPGTEDDPFDLLCNARRLYLLEYLHDQDTPIQLTDAAAHIAARENEKPPAELDNEERRRVYISLYQTHLQLLLERGVIDWDEATNAIELADVSSVEPYLDTVETPERRWDHAHLSLAVLGLLSVALAIPDVHPFSAIPVAGYLGVVSVATVALAIFRVSDLAGDASRQ